MGGFAFVRLMTLSFNSLIFLAGLTLLATGTWTSVNGSFFLQTLAPFSGEAAQGANVGFFCIATGAPLVLLGLLGCCGAHQESRCLLLTFFSIILVIFVAEVTAGLLVLAYSSFAESILRAWATPALREDYGSDPVVTSVWNVTMTELRCCGFNNYTDFIGSKFGNESSGSLPLSCCWTNITACSREEARRSGVQGCVKGILTTLKAHASTVGSIAAGTGILQVAAMGVALYLYFHLDNGEHGHSRGAT